MNIDVPAVIEVLRSSDHESIDDVLDDLRIILESEVRPMHPDIRIITHEVMNRLLAGTWPDRLVLSGLFSLGKSYMCTDGPSVIQFSAQMLPWVTTTDIGFQLLIGVENYLMRGSAEDRDAAAMLIADFKNRPELWTCDPDIVARLQRRLARL